MRPILIVMLAVQAGILLATIFAVCLRKPTAARPGPIWSSLAVALFIVGMTSNEIAADHPGAPGTDIVAFGSPFLMGMALMCLLLLFKQLRDRRHDGTATAPVSAQ
jgi:hypothetical protein